MTMQEKILDVLRRGGPQVAPKVAREVKGEAIIVSAYLSELKASGKVKISQMKIGTSPLYYLPGQEKQLVLFADRLNPKDRSVFDKLEQLKVLREAQLDLLGKVALRKMKDFAIPLQVSIGGQTELFWRWYMLDPAETNLIVSSLLQQVGPRDEMQEITSEALSTPVDPNLGGVTVKPVISQTVTVENVPTAASLAFEQTQTRKVTVEDGSELRNPWGSEYPPNTTIRGEAIVESVYPINTTATDGGLVLEDTMHTQVVEVINTADIDSMEPSEFESVGNEIDVEEVIEEFSETIKPVEIQKEIVLEKVPEKIKEEKEILVEIKPAEKPVEKQKSLVEKIKETFLPKHKGNAGDLLPYVEAFCKSHKITIVSSEVVRKNADLSLQVLVPSAVGDVLFFCKVRQKKRCDEKDISAAYMEAQVGKLPLLFLYTEEVSAKATEFLESGSFDNLLLMKLDVNEK